MTTRCGLRQSITARCSSLAIYGDGSALARLPDGLLSARIAKLVAAFAALRGEAVKNQVMQQEIAMLKRAGGWDLNVLAASARAAF